MFSLSCLFNINKENKTSNFYIFKVGKIALFYIKFKFDNI